MNTIEPSKSSRASCRICGQKIEKGIARLGVVETFVMQGNEVTQTKWHHLKCGMDKLPEAVLSAKVEKESSSRGKTISLASETLKMIEDFKNKHNTAGVAVKGLGEITSADSIVNISGTVIRKLGSVTDSNPKGDDELMSKVYVKDDHHRSSIFLWGENAKIEMSKDDTLVILKARSFLATNDNIQFHASDEATVLVNPTEEELSANTESFDLFVSSAWKRPQGKFAEFGIAPSGRAICGYCQEKIPMGELKLLKPDYLELPTGRTIGGHVSFHTYCILSDEQGPDVVHEAITRLTPSMLDESRAALQHFYELMPNGKPKSILEQLL